MQTFQTNLSGLPSTGSHHPSLNSNHDAMRNQATNQPIWPQPMPQQINPNFSFTELQNVPPPMPQPPTHTNPNYQPKALNDSKPPLPPKCSNTAICELASLTHLDLKISRHDKIDEAFAGIVGMRPSRRDGPLQYWHLPLSSYESAKAALDLLSKSETSGLRITFKPIPDLVFRILKAARETARDDSARVQMLKDIDDEGPPIDPPLKKSLWDKLMPFQREGVEFGLRRDGRCIIADEMGLGKTIQSLCLLQCYRQEGPALIISPSSLRGAWADALVTWLPDVAEKDVQVCWKKADLCSKATASPLVICSYELISSLQQELLRRKFTTVILDEAHYIKTSTTQRSQAALPLCRDAKRCILLSGTPMMNKPEELTPLLRAILPSVNMRDAEFNERYCIMDAQYKTKFKEAINERELYHLMQSVMIRRKKLDVLPQLPSKIRQRIDLKLDPKEMAMLRDCSPEARYHRTAVAKIRAARLYVKELLVREEGLKVLIFAHHMELLDGIAAECQESKVGYIRIDGNTDQRIRPQLVKDFQENKDIRVAVLSIRASGQGLTLTAASLVLFAELSYTPGEIQQAEDRAHRIGQVSSVLVQFLMAKGSVDDHIWAAVQSKLDDVGTILDGKGDQMEVLRSQGSAALLAGKSDTRSSSDKTSQQAAVISEAAVIPSRKRAAGQPGINQFFKPRTVGALSSSIVEGDVGGKPTSPASSFKKQRIVEVD